MHTFIIRRLAVFLCGLLILPPPAGAVPIVFSGSGANAAGIQTVVDSFRAAIGDPNNGNAPGALASGRREINWDGGGSTLTTAPVTPFNVFLNTRGSQFTTPGTGLTQATADGLSVLLGNPTYATTFTTFSAQRLFAPIGSNVTDGLFFVPGSNGAVEATISAFGMVFSDVDLAATTAIEYFDINGDSLGKFFADIFDNGLSFLGVQFSNELISRIRITTGNSALGPNDGAGLDVVVMDDFIYAEPQAIPEPSVFFLLATGLAVFGRRRLKEWIMAL